MVPVIRPGFWRWLSAVALGVLLALWLCGGDREADAKSWQMAGLGTGSVPRAYGGRVSFHAASAALSVAREGRTFHKVALAQLSKTQWTHVEVCGLVTLVKMEADGDLHVRLDDGGAFIVAETVPYHRLASPRLAQRICVRGISREDKTHHWYEVHPVESWRVQ